MINAIHFTPIFTDKNRGIRAEKDALFTLFRVEKQKHDNIKGTESPDFYFHDYGIQCKSARATICSGTNYKQYILCECACDKFLYVCYRDETLYFMDKSDFIAFCDNFSFVDIDSSGKQKVRIRKESYELREWLYSRAKVGIYDM